jgi:hypothetical protein
MKYYILENGERVACFTASEIRDDVLNYLQEEEEHALCSCVIEPEDFRKYEAKDE